MADLEDGDASEMARGETAPCEAAKTGDAEEREAAAYNELLETLKELVKEEPPPPEPPTPAGGDEAPEGEAQEANM